MRESRLIEKLKAHDRDALDRAITQYTPYVSVILYRMLAGTAARQDVEELTADVFLALWQTADRMTGESLTAYLAAIARNKAISRLRLRQPDTLPLEDEWLPAGEDASAAVLRQGQRAVLECALEALGMPDTEIFRRFYFEGQSVREIARGMGLAGGTVRTRLFRGRQKLKRYFTERGIGYEELI